MSRRLSFEMTLLGTQAHEVPLRDVVVDDGDDEDVDDDDDDDDEDVDDDDDDDDDEDVDDVDDDAHHHHSKCICGQVSCSFDCAIVRPLEMRRTRG